VPLAHCVITAGAVNIDVTFARQATRIAQRVAARVLRWHWRQTRRGTRRISGRFMFAGALRQERRASGTRVARIGVASAFFVA